MKIILLGVFAAGFVYAPFYVLDTLVMPDLQNLKQTYSNEDQTVQNLFPQ
jgi:hypothetical protein